MWPAETWLLLLKLQGLGRSEGIVQQQEGLIPRFSLETSASLTGRELEDIQSIRGAGAEVGPLPPAS